MSNNAACSSDSNSDTSTLRSKDSGLSTMASMQADILSANEEAEMAHAHAQRLRRQSERPMTVAEFNLAQRRKAAMAAKAAAMHAYVNLPPKLIGRAENDAPPPLPQKDVGYASAENSPQHRSEFWFASFYFHTEGDSGGQNSWLG